MKESIKIALVQQHATKDIEENVERGIGYFKEAAKNGYFSALVNRVGEEEVDHFGGGSYVVDPDGQVLAKAGEEDDEIIYAEINREKIEESSAKQHFLKDRRPDFYRKLR